MRPDEFNGSESVDDILSAVLENFSFPGAKIIYAKKVRYLTIEYTFPSHHVCKYRIDGLLRRVYATCEATYDHYAKRSQYLTINRDALVRVFAYTAMSLWLDHAMVRQAEMFQEIDDETGFVSMSIMFESITKNAAVPENNPAVVKTLNTAVRESLDNHIKELAKRRRDYLAGFLNKLPLLTVPMKAGRPLGSTKPEEKKLQEAVQFSAKVEAAIRSLYKAKKKMPTKTAVAQFLNSGGVNQKTGTASSLQVFSTKLTRMGIDYKKLAERLERELSNNSD